MRNLDQMQGPFTCKVYAPYQSETQCPPAHSHVVIAPLAKPGTRIVLRGSGTLQDTFNFTNGTTDTIVAPNLMLAWSSTK